MGRKKRKKYLRSISVENVCRLRVLCTVLLVERCGVRRPDTDAVNVVAFLLVELESHCRRSDAHLAGIRLCVRELIADHPPPSTLRDAGRGERNVAHDVVRVQIRAGFAAVFRVEHFVAHFGVRLNKPFLLHAVDEHVADVVPVAVLNDECLGVRKHPQEIIVAHASRVEHHLDLFAEPSFDHRVDLLLRKAGCLCTRGAHGDSDLLVEFGEVVHRINNTGRRPRAVDDVGVCLTRERRDHAGVRAADDHHLVASALPVLGVDDVLVVLQEVNQILDLLLDGEILQVLDREILERHGLAEEAVLGSEDECASLLRQHLDGVVDAIRVFLRRLAGDRDQDGAVGSVPVLVDNVVALLESYRTLVEVVKNLVKKIIKLKRKEI